MKNYKIIVHVDQQWFEILGQISKNQEGFVWEKVKAYELED